jgi:branched-chain amino acid transport system substrate-binding protein
MKSGLVAAVVVAGLALAACGSSDDSGSGSTTPSSSGSSSASASAGSASFPSDGNAWALKYTGGKAGAASGDPYKIGYASQDLLLPDATVGAKAAVAYINAELGGIAGRPIQMVECQVNSPEDGARCGAQFANDPSIHVVVVGAIAVGTPDLYKAVNGKVTVIVSNAFSTEDFVTPAAVSYTSGLPGVLGGMAQFVGTDLKAKTVAVLLGDTPGGRAAVAGTLKPVFDAAGVTMKPVFIPAAATAPDVASALTAAGVSKTDVVFIATPVGNCIEVYDALKTSGDKPKVLTTDLCSDQPMADHLKQVGDKGVVPDGWYLGNYGYSYGIPDVDSGLNTYVNAVMKYGKPAQGAKTLGYTGVAGYSFGSFMAATKIINQTGADASNQQLNTALRAFTGPMMMQAGPLKCGLAPLTAVCGRQMGIDQYVNGGWVSVRDGVNKNPIQSLPAS